MRQSMGHLEDFFGGISTAPCIWQSLVLFGSCLRVQHVVLGDHFWIRRIQRNAWSSVVHAMRELQSWARSLCPCCAMTGTWSDSAESRAGAAVGVYRVPHMVEQLVEGDDEVEFYSQRAKLLHARPGDAKFLMQQNS